jgi:hypothetical protein
MRNSFVLFHLIVEPNTHLIMHVCSVSTFSMLWKQNILCSFFFDSNMICSWWPINRWFITGWSPVDVMQCAAHSCRGGRRSWGHDLGLVCCGIPCSRDRIISTPGPKSILRLWKAPNRLKSSFWVTLLFDFAFRSGGAAHSCSPNDALIFLLEYSKTQPFY